MDSTNDKQQQSAHDALATVKRAAALRKWTPSDLAPVLGIPARDWAKEDDEDLVIYTAHSRQWRRVELRKTVDNAAHGELLELDFAERVPFKDVIREFGANPSMTPPNPAARDKAEVGYEYRSGAGVLRFLAPYSATTEIVSAVIDRMPGS